MEGSRINAQALTLPRHSADEGVATSVLRMMDTLKTQMYGVIQTQSTCVAQTSSTPQPCAVAQHLLIGANKLIHLVCGHGRRMMLCQSCSAMHESRLW